MGKFLADWRRFIVSNNLLRQDHSPAEERLAANLLFSLLLTVGVILIFFVTPRHFINPASDVITRALLSLVGGVIALLASYVCKLGHYHIVINCAIFVGPAWIVFASISRTDIDAVLPLYYLSPIFIFVSFFLSERMMLVSLMMNALTFIICILYASAVPPIEFIEGPLSFYVIAATMTILLVRHRARLAASQKRELQESERRFRTVIDRGQDEFYLLNAVRDEAGTVIDFTLVDANKRAMAQIENYRKNSTVEPKGVRDYSPAEDPTLGRRTFELYKSVFDTGETNIAEIEVRRADLPQRWYYRQVLRVGEGVALLMRDITLDKLSEQRAMELNLQREKVSILHSFIQDASHDLRTPLAVMGTSSYLLNALSERMHKLLGEADLQARRTDMNTVTEKMQRNTEQIVQSSERLHRLIEDMLEMASLDYQAAFTLTPRSLNSIIRTLVDKTQTLAERRDVSLTYTLSEPSMQVNVDESAFTHALEHILNNAIQFTPAGGHISVNLVSQGDKVAIEIKDTGIGIAPEELPHIFERFYRADRARQQSTGGTGLGLPIAQKIIEAHGGKIEVETQVGQGSTFRVWITPLKAPVAISAMAPQSAHDSAIHRPLT